MSAKRFPFLIVLVLAAALAAGCSERAARITGNERLLRGVAGLGTTFTSDTLVTQDTYVTPATTQIKGATLLVGNQPVPNQGTFQARSLFRPITWTLPADTLAIVDSIRFRVEYDTLVNENLPPGGTFYQLYQAAAPWDTTNVQWPGPPLGTLLGQGPDALAPLTIDLGASAIGTVRAWSRDSTFAGFVLNLDAGTGVRGFRAGTGRLEIVTHPAASPGTFTTTTTRLATDLTIHSPASPASGTETELLLGGLFQSEALLKAPVAPPSPGFSIDAATFVAHITSPAFPTDELVQIQAFQVGNPWTEGGASVDSTLGLATTALATINNYRVRATGDSIVVPVPISVARQWAQDSTSNHGILIRITNSFDHPEIRLASRESATPPTLRVSTTTPPPGRFAGTILK